MSWATMVSTGRRSRGGGLDDGEVAGAGEGEILLDERFRVVDPADHADGVGPVVGADQQRLRLRVADAADGRKALHLVEDVLKPGAEGRVFDVVDLALQADKGVPGRHTAPAGAQVGMVVGAEKHVGHTVGFGCDSEKASHGETS